MELRHIYQIANGILGSIEEDAVKSDMLNNLDVTVKVSPATHYGIDKEFYRITHGNNTNGFVHSSNNIIANISGVNFTIVSDEESRS